MPSIGRDVDMSAPQAPIELAHALERTQWLRIEPGQLILAALLGIEIVTFSLIGTNFLSLANAFEVLRLCVEIGLLAVALTPVITSGGIDLSVGSLMGLSAVVFGELWRDRGLPIVAAAAATIVLGGLAGSLNGVVITRGRIPPLIVTLGSFSLYRGLAEGLTGGVDNYTNFPRSFLFLGQGYSFGGVPTQVPVFVLVAIAFWVLLHRSAIGRSLVAIGYSPEGARYAGLPVDRLVGLVYVLSGLVASLAAVIYVSHLGQAKADAGTGYELAAITAVVLGGTSIFGGRGSVPGTLLGLFAIAVLQNGLRLADLPAELAGVLTGTLLLVAIGLDRRTLPARALSHSQPSLEVMNVKNSQVAVICAAILAAALINVASNFILVQSLSRERFGREPAAAPTAAGMQPARRGSPAPGRGQITVAMMPKSKGNAYFIACRKGASRLLPSSASSSSGMGRPNPTRRSRTRSLIRGSPAGSMSSRSPSRTARESPRCCARPAIAGSRSSPGMPTPRPTPATSSSTRLRPRASEQALMDNAARILGGKGSFAIITASLTAANMIEWQKCIEARRREKYPQIKMAALRPCDDLQKKAFDEAKTILNAEPDVKLFMAICTPAVPGAAEAVKQSGRTDVKVIGLGLPNDNNRYVHEGITDCVVLWNTMDLGYLTVQAAVALAEGALKPGATELRAGRLKKIEIQGDNILLGQPFLFTKDNIDQFDF